MDLTKNEQKILLKVNNEMYISQLSKLCDINSSNSTGICRKLEEKELIYFKKVKHMKYVMLTEEGQNVKDILLKLIDK